MVDLLPITNFQETKYSIYLSYTGSCVGEFTNVLNKCCTFVGGSLSQPQSVDPSLIYLDSSISTHSTRSHMTTRLVVSTNYNYMYYF